MKTLMIWFKNSHTHTHTIVHKSTDKSSSSRHSQEDSYHLVWMSGPLQQCIFCPLNPLPPKHTHKHAHTPLCLCLTVSFHFTLTQSPFLTYFLSTFAYFSFSPLLLSSPNSSLYARLVWYNRRVLLHAHVVLSGREQECLGFFFP